MFYKGSCQLKKKINLTLPPPLACMLSVLVQFTLRSKFIIELYILILDQIVISNISYYNMPFPTNKNQLFGQSHSVNFSTRNRVLFFAENWNVEAVHQDYSSLPLFSKNVHSKSNSEYR